MERRREKQLACIFCSVLISTTIICLLWLPHLVSRNTRSDAERDEYNSRRRPTFGQRTHRLEDELTKDDELLSALLQGRNQEQKASETFIRSSVIRATGAPRRRRMVDDRLSVIDFDSGSGDGSADRFLDGGLRDEVPLSNGVEEPVPDVDDFVYDFDDQILVDSDPFEVRMKQAGRQLFEVREDPDQVAFSEDDIGYAVPKSDIFRARL